jgi:hypothetical protein
MKRLTLMLLLLSVSSASAGIYAPAAGQAGSTAIYKDDDALVAWATGWSDYQAGTGCDATWQTSDKALGKAVGNSYDIVCLGNGGQITLTFDSAISDGEDYDFAVFENAISDTFLELAWVEVSSDGTTFYRLPNDSRTASPVAGFGSLDPTNIDGLAGKYRQGWGTPFDLADVGLSEISYVRIIDIVGDGSALDTGGDVIYDPYPNTGSAGFDLEAVGVIHQIPEPASLLLIIPGVMGFLRRRLS